MSHFGPEEAIARIADWKGHDVRYEELGGGITNHNYIVWVDGGPPQGKKYVLRVPGHRHRHVHRPRRRALQHDPGREGRRRAGGRLPDRP